MSLVLYRKYRPQVFSDIVGQEHVVQTLSNAVSSGIISHAYLFSGPRGSGKCVKFDTKVVDFSSGEILTVEEIYKRKRISLLTLHSNYRLKNTKPSNFINDGIKPCYRVKTALGKEIEITLSHPFLTIEGWKKLSELKTGDYIGIPRTLPVFGKEKIPEYKVRLIAHLIAEGSTYDPNGSIGFTNSDSILVRDFISAAKKFKNIKIVKYDCKGTKTPTYRATQIVRHNWINQPGQSKNPIMGFIKNLGLAGQKSKTKTIPSIIFRSTKSLISLFLRVLYSGDGGIDISKRATISYYSSSKYLIHQIQHLLLRFSIISRVRYKPAKFRNRIYSNWALEIYNRESLLKFIKEIGFIGEKAKKLRVLNSYLSNRPTNPNCDVIPIEVWDLVKTEKEINNGSWVEVGKILNYKKPKKFSNTVRFRPSRDKLQICGEVFNSQEILNIATSDIYWDKITEIKHTGDFQVYDLVVPGTHNFVANDFIVHNTTIARLLAKSLNCLNRKEGQFEPCNKCSSCLEILGNRSLDLIEIDAASHRGIDEMRELRDGIKFAPSKSKYKIFIIDESHQLTKEAANALLKTLEEPPSHAIFILATTEIHKMIPTIISRCQRFDFRKLTLAEIVKKLEFVAKKEGIKIEKPALELIALSAAGSVRDAESILGQVLNYQDGQEIKTETIKEILGLVEIGIVSQFCDLLFEKKASKALNSLNELVEKGIDLQEFTKALINYLRRALIFKISGLGSDWWAAGLTKEELENLKKQSNVLKEDELRKIIDLFLEAESTMKYSSIPQLPLELAIIEAVGKKEE